jgi:hypothetical protein
MNREPEDSGYDLKELESELEGRRLRVWEVCVARGLNMEGEPNAWEFFIDSSHGLVWCNIFKAASSTWLHNFNLLGKCIKNVFFYFGNKRICGFPVTKAWRVLRLRMDEQHPAMEGSCGYIE